MRARDIAAKPDNGRRPYIEIARDPDDELWYWVMWAENGVAMAQSPAGYKRRNNMTDALKIMLDTIGPQTKIVIAHEPGQH